jgi:hypothetical protein
MTARFVSALLSHRTEDLQCLTTLLGWDRHPYGREYHVFFTPGLLMVSAALATCKQSAEYVPGKGRRTSIVKPLLLNGLGEKGVGRSDLEGRDDVTIYRQKTLRRHRLVGTRDPESLHFRQEGCPL